MGDRQMNHQDLASWLRRLPSYLYVADLIAGKRVLEVQCGVGDGARFLIECGAARVVGIDHSAEHIGQARRRFQLPNLVFRHERLGSLELGDDMFDCIIVPDGTNILDRPAVLGELRRTLTPNGHLIVNVVSADRAPGVSGASYHDIGDTLRSGFSPVRMVAQSPLVAMSLVEYATSEIIDVELDTSLLEWARTPNTEVTDYLAICGGPKQTPRPCTIVQLPSRWGVETLGRSLDDRSQSLAAIGTNGARTRLLNGADVSAQGNADLEDGTVSTQIAAALHSHAELTRTLEQELSEQRAYSDELREEFHQVWERAETAEKARASLEEQTTALRQELSNWRSRASVAEGEAMRARIANGEDLSPPSEQEGEDTPAKGVEEAGQSDESQASAEDTIADRDKTIAALRAQLAQAEHKLGRMTRQWNDTEAKYEAASRRVAELQKLIDNNREQSDVHAAEARRIAQLNMAKAIEDASSMAAHLRDQLNHCEKRCSLLESELESAQKARAYSEHRIAELEAERRMKSSRATVAARTTTDRSGETVPPPPTPSDQGADSGEDEATQIMAIPPMAKEAAEAMEADASIDVDEADEAEAGSDAQQGDNPEKEPGTDA